MNQALLKKIFLFVSILFLSALFCRQLGFSQKNENEKVAQDTAEVKTLPDFSTEPNPYILQSASFDTSTTKVNETADNPSEPASNAFVAAEKLKEDSTNNVNLIQVPDSLK